MTSDMPEPARRTRPPTPGLCRNRIVAGTVPVADPQLRLEK